MKKELDTLKQNKSQTLIPKSEMKIPQSLYIPPGALEVYLECFTGPLDLLLYLIRQKNLSISEISIRKVTDQYLSYVDNLSYSKFELVAEYLLMAALLAEIKSRELLPKSKADPNEDEQEQILIENLRQYAILTQATDQLNQLPRLNRDFFLSEVKRITYPKQLISRLDGLKKIDSTVLKNTFEEILLRKERYKKYKIEFEQISTSEKMAEIIKKLKTNSGEFIRFEKLLNFKEGRLGVVVQFISLLELTKEGVIDIRQQINGAIYAKAN